MGVSYSEKLKDPRWQRMRLDVMERDGFTCTLCYGASETLHVHHGYYEFGKEPWEYDKHSLFTLCETCHKTAETNRTHLKILCGVISVEHQIQLATLLTRMLQLGYGDSLILLDETIAKADEMIAKYGGSGGWCE